MSEDFQSQLEQAKLDALKELAYGASHEINNPLASIAARAQTLLRDEPHAERRRSLEAIHQQALRAHEMISDLMLVARPPRANFEHIDLRNLLVDAVQELEAEATRRHITINHDQSGEPLRLVGDAQQLAVAIRAMLVNAMESIGAEGRIELRTSEDRVEPNENWVRFEIEDDGPGISPEVREHIFDPFFSGREAGRGLGFGLCKSWRIVADHAGQILVNSPSDGGATFTVQLPCQQPVENRL